MAEPVLSPDTLDGYCLAEDVIHALACGVLPPNQRSRALAHLDDCELCQALVADEVRALPASMSSPVEDAGANALMQVDALVAGRYRIQRFVARGGMGEVYEAWDVMLSERVALKTINPVSAVSDQAKANARFKQEVLFARRVGDPHVCRIYEFGQHLVRGVGTLSYLTMEYIEGQTLGARLRQGPRPTMAELLELSRQMLSGLAAAHAVGVLHRDFKSDNVMLRAKPEEPGALHAVIMDFGLARVLGDQAHRLTERHELVGSAAYMAPEQLEEGAALSEATDIYAFGVVLFEMLTGRLPFEGKSAVAVALRRLTHPAPPPSVHVPELAGAWDALVLRCLERDVARRFASTAEVIAALERVAEGRRPVRARSRRKQEIALALAAGSALLGVAGYFALAREGPGGAPEARAEHDVTLTLQPEAAPRVQQSPPLLAPPTGVDAPPQSAGEQVAPAALIAAGPELLLPPEASGGAASSASAEAGSGALVAAPAPAAGSRGSSTPAVPAARGTSTRDGRRTSASARGASRAPERTRDAAARERSAPAPASAASAPQAAPAAAPAQDRAQDVRELFFLEPPSERGAQNAER